MSSKMIWFLIMILFSVMPFQAAGVEMTQDEIIGGSPGERGQGRSAGRDKARPERLLNLKGTLHEISRFELSGMDESHLFAKIKTPQGNLTHVDLGPADELEKFDLREGKEVSVYGLKGTVNNRPMLIAMNIETRNREGWIRRPHDMNLRRFEVRILKTRVASFETYDIPDQLLARAGMGQGESTLVVNLGPAANFPEDVMLEGEEVFLLARPARIGGKTALIAEEVYTEDGRLIDIDWTRP